MAYSLFITKQDILEWASEVSQNIDDKYWVSNARAAQELFIRERLGNPLYDDFYYEYSNNTLTAQYEALLAKIKPVLVFYTLTDYMYTLQVRQEGQGIILNVPEGGESAEIPLVDRVSQNYKNKAMRYAEQLSEFLCLNHNDYPLYPYNNPAQKQADLAADEDWGFGVMG